MCSFSMLAFQYGSVIVVVVLIIGTKWGAWIFKVWRVMILVEEWGASMVEDYLDLCFHICSFLSLQQ